MRLLAALKSFWNLLPCSVLVIDEKGLIRAVNRMTEKLFHFSSDELIEQSIAMIFPSRFRAIQQASLQRILQSSAFLESNPEMEFWGLSREGREFPLTVGMNTLNFPEGKVGLISFFALPRPPVIEDTLWFRILDASEDLVAIVNPSLAYEFVNKVFENLHGLPRSEILGKPMADFLTPTLFERVVKPYLDRSFGGEKVSYQYRFEFRDQGFRKMDVTYTPVQIMNSGSVERVMIQARDITDLEKLEYLILTIQQILNGRKGSTIPQETKIEKGPTSLKPKPATSDLAKVAQLTPQKKTILACVAQGKTNKEIATLLNLSDKTVRNHLTSIFRKLGITRRPEAASIFIRSALEAHEKIK